MVISNQLARRQVLSGVVALSVGTAVSGWESAEVILDDIVNLTSAWAT